MSLPVAAGQTDIPILRLDYDTKGNIDADKIGAVITEIGKSFSQFERRRGKYRLAVRAAGSGSFWIEFIVLAGAAGPLVTTFQKEIIEYTDFLANLVSIYTGLRDGRPTAQDKRVVKALNAPVASGQAVQLNISTQGNANSVVINGNISISIAQYDARQIRHRGDLEGMPPLEDYADVPLLPASKTMIERLDGHFGTILLVEGQWYVRLEGEEGVLNPLDLASSSLTVKHNRAYLLSGQWEGRRYRIWAAEPIG